MPLYLSCACFDLFDHTFCTCISIIILAKKFDELHVWVHQAPASCSEQKNQYNGSNCQNMFKRSMTAYKLQPTTRSDFSKQYNFKQSNQHVCIKIKQNFICKDADLEMHSNIWVLKLQNTRQKVTLKAIILNVSMNHANTEWTKRTIKFMTYVGPFTNSSFMVLPSSCNLFWKIQ